MKFAPNYKQCCSIIYYYGWFGWFLFYIMLYIMFYIMTHMAYTTGRFSKVYLKPKPYSLHLEDTLVGSFLDVSLDCLVIAQINYQKIDNARITTTVF